MLYVLMEGTELVRMEFVVRYHGPVFHVVDWKLIHLPGKLRVNESRLPSGIP